MNWLLGLVLAVLFLFAVMGYSKGIIKMVISVVSMILTFVLVSVFSPQIGEALRETEVYSNLYVKTYAAITDKIDEEIDREAFLSEAGDLTEKSTEIIEKLGLPESICTAITEKIDVNSSIYDGIDGLIDSIAVWLTDYIFDAVIFIISFIIVLFAVKLIFAAINLISYLPVIHGLNKFAGLLLGIVEGILVVWIIFIAITIFGGTELNSEVFAMINDNTFLAALYNNNIIMSILFK